MVIEVRTSGEGRHRAPLLLAERAARVVAERWLATGLGDGVRAELEVLPTAVADVLTATLVGQCVGTQHGDPLALVDVLAESVTHVDLSPLVWLGQRRPADLTAFNERLAAALPRLGRLTALTLSTHGRRFTLPVCADDTLHAVARCCPALRTLDVSHNTSVSASGLDALCRGCPRLEELLLYDCVLPAAVLAAVLAGLPTLRVLGHQEAGAAVLLLFKQSYQEGGEDDCHQHALQDHWPDYGPGLQGQYNGLHDYDSEAQRVSIQNQDPHTFQRQDGGLEGQNTRAGRRQPLRLTQVANLGETALHRSKGAGEPDRLRCRGALVFALRTLCPDLCELRVRVLDDDVPRLATLPGLTTLELRFHASTKPSSMGSRTLSYLRLHGARLTALTVYSHGLRTSDFHLVGEHCPYLRQLWMRCNTLIVDGPLEGPAGQRYSRLENLSLRVGANETSRCGLPPEFMRALVRHAPLRKLYVAANSADVGDVWLGAVLDALPDRGALRSLFILLPNNNSLSAPRVALGPDSLQHVIDACPGLEELGNLVVWCFQHEEVRHIQRRLRDSNCVLKLVAKEMTWR